MCLALALARLAGALANGRNFRLKPSWGEGGGTYPLVQVLHEALEQLQEEQAASTGTEVFWISQWSELRSVCNDER
ncbi:hypothetical protein BC629DRAFT_1568981 [Irpex lacteus]|nr:hypothetical protein BC629DRAFT_1568981 [Irpex lacteus]